MEHIHLLEIPIVEGLRKNGSGRVLWCLVSTWTEGGPRATPAIYHQYARFVEPRVLHHEDLELHGLPSLNLNIAPLLANMFRWSPIMPCENEGLLLSKEMSLSLSSVQWDQSTTAAIHAAYFKPDVDVTLHNQFAEIHCDSDLDWHGAEHHSIIRTVEQYRVPAPSLQITMCRPKHVSRFAAGSTVWQIPLGLLHVYIGRRDSPIPISPDAIAAGGIVLHESVFFCSEAVINQIYPFIDPLHFSLYAYLAPKR